MIMRVICRKRKKTIKGDLISASCIHSDKEIFHSYFLKKKNVDVLKNIFENLLRIFQELLLRRNVRNYLLLSILLISCHSPVL